MKSNEPEAANHAEAQWLIHVVWLQNEEAKVERVKEATIMKLRNVEKQKGDVEKLRDDLK